MNLRYDRQMQLPEIGVEGQRKLGKMRVLCVGAGGIGCSALLYLTGLGIGKIGICDADIIDIHNLPRQILFQEKDIGQRKSTTAVCKLRQQNSEVCFEDIPVDIQEANAFSLISQYDIVLDASDNFVTKYLLNDACYFLQKPLISASVFQFRGQCSVFDFPSSPCLRCIYPKNDALINFPNCEMGVLGMIPGFLGILEALEVVKWGLALPFSLAGKLFTWDMLRNESKTYMVSKDPDCALCTPTSNSDTMKGGRSLKESKVTLEITASELKMQLDQQKDICLLDVRSEAEHAGFNIGGMHIPLPELSQSLDLLPRNKPIVVYCRTGKRSLAAAELLVSAGFPEVKTLNGGVTAWCELFSIV